MTKFTDLFNGLTDMRTFMTREIELYRVKNPLGNLPCSIKVQHDLCDAFGINTRYVSRLPAWLRDRKQQNVIKFDLNPNS